ncbi:MAG: transporter, partial [Edaphobacter sp.]
MGTLLHGNALLALGAAVLWGGGDFSGGMGVKRAGGSMRAALRVILLSHSVSLGILLVLVFWRGDAFPHGAPLAWGVGAGVTAGVALACFYVALSR